MTNQFHFASERLSCRALMFEDIEVLFQIYLDSHAMRFRGSKPMSDAEDAKRMVEEQRITNKDFSKTRLAIIKKVDKQLLGTLLLTQKTNYPQVMEVGFSIGKAYWGSGFGQEILDMVEKGLLVAEKRIELRAWCIKRNYASVKIFQKSGYTELMQDKHPQSILFSKKLELKRLKV